MLAIQTTPMAQAVLPRAPVAAPLAPLLASVNANGWSAQWASGTPPTLAPDVAPQTVALTRAGFDAAGAPISVGEALVLTQRVRQPWPNHASPTAATVALSDYVYASDGIVGVTNGSAEASPKPIVQWVTPARMLVGDSIGGSAVPVELVAFHRNARGGRQVAAVKFLISDGTTTVSATVSTTVVSGRVGDRNAVLVYRLPAIDISALAPGLVTVNAEVYPWIGGSGSVAKSASDGADARGFSPRHFLKNVARAASPPLAYVSSAGNDATGIWSTVAAAAAGTPFLTVAGALAAHGDATRGAPATGGVVDGCEIRLGAGSFALGASTVTRTQNVAALTITRDPDVAPTAAIATFGAAGFRPRLGGALTSPVATAALRLVDLTVQRTGTLALQGEAGAQLEIVFDGVAFDNGGHNATWLAQAHDYHLGTTFTNLSGGSPLGAGTLEHRLLRGISLQPASVAGGIPVEGWSVIGSSIRNPLFLPGTRSQSGAVIAFNTLSDPPTSAVMMGIGGGADVSGLAFAQNAVEYVSATTAAVLRISGDNDTGSTSHVVIHQNSHAGAFQCGRWNAFYDEGGTPRTSKLMSVVGNIAATVYTKSDVFRGANQANPEGFSSGSPSTRAGNWPFMYGVGCQGNFSQFQSQTPIGGNEAQAYPGLGAKYGTDAVARNNPLFASYAGTTVSGTIGSPVYAAGAGGGSYTLQGGSPAKAMVARGVLSHTLDGAARAATGDHAGALSAA